MIGAERVEIYELLRNVLTLVHGVKASVINGLQTQVAKLEPHLTAHEEETLLGCHPYFLFGL